MMVEWNIQKPCIFKEINCFNDPAWTTTTQRVLGGVVGGVGHRPTTYIQLAGAGSKIEAVKRYMVSWSILDVYGEP